MDFIKRLGKKEILGILFGMAILAFGLLMQISRVAIPRTEGLLSKGIWILGDWFFAENVTVVSLVVVAVTVLPAVFIQVLTWTKLMFKLQIPYCQLAFYLLIYGVSLGFYRNCTLPAGELVLFLLVTAVCYFVLRLYVNGTSKKILVLLLGLAGLAAVTVFLEFPSFHWQIYAQCAIIGVESIVMAWCRGKTVLLRKTLRSIGTMLLLAIFALVSCVC